VHTLALREKNENGNEILQPYHLPSILTDRTSPLCLHFFTTKEKHVEWVKEIAKVLPIKEEESIRVAPSLFYLTHMEEWVSQMKGNSNLKKMDLVVDEKTGW